MEKTILILGAGTGGIISANELSKKVGGKVKILLFEKEEKNVFAPSLLWLMVGRRKAHQVYRETEKISSPWIEIVIGEIEHVNPEKISVTVKGQEYRGDYMVVSLGVEQVTEYNLNKVGYDFYTLEGATGFNNALQNFKGGKIAILVPSLPFKCPAAPYEAAMLIEGFIHKKGLRDITEISLYTPELKPMGVAGKKVSDAVRQIIEQKDVRYYPEHHLKSVKENSLSFSNGETTKFDLLAYTPKHQCPTVIKETSLVGKSGWIEVDRNTMETNIPNVYALGDIVFIPLEIGSPLPKAGVFAHAQAKVVAHNIAQKIQGKIPDKIFKGKGQCFLELGNGKAGFAGGNFYASPSPNIKMKMPGHWWHWMKVIFEKSWFYKNF